MKKIPAVIAALAVSALPLLAATPAQAVHAGQEYCSSSNSNKIVTVWLNGYGNTPYKQLYNGDCTVVPSAYVSTVKVQVTGCRFRVGYDRKPYQAWQYLSGPYGDNNNKLFRTSDNDLIYFETDTDGC